MDYPADEVRCSSLAVELITVLLQTDNDGRSAVSGVDDSEQDTEKLIEVLGRVQPVTATKVSKLNSTVFTQCNAFLSDKRSLGGNRVAGARHIRGVGARWSLPAPGCVAIHLLHSTV